VKKTFIMILAICAIATAQDLPRIAVYVTGEVPNNQKKALGTMMLAALVNSKRYKAIERTEYFLAEIEKEQIKQRSGAIDDGQISQLGRQFGVKFVCIADITPVFGMSQVSARIINVETAEVEYIGEESRQLLTSDALSRVIDNIMIKMFGEEIKAVQRLEPYKPEPPKRDTTKTYTVTMYASPSNGGTVSCNPSYNYYREGTIVTVSAYPSIGYTFTGWRGAVESEDNNITITVNDNIALAAQFQRYKTSAPYSNTEKTDTLYIPPTSYWGVRGLSQTVSAEPMGTGRLNISVFGSYFEQDQDLGVSGAPDKGTGIFLGRAALSGGLNSWFDGFLLLPMNMNGDKEFAVGEIVGGIQASLTPFSLPEDFPMKLAAQLHFIYGFTKPENMITRDSNYIYRNLDDREYNKYYYSYEYKDYDSYAGYDFFDTRGSFDVIAKLAQSLVFKDLSVIKFHFNEGIAFTPGGDWENLLLLAAGLELDPFKWLTMGIEGNWRTKLKKEVSSDPFWITPSLMVRTPWNFGILGGCDVRALIKEDKTTKPLQAWRAFGEVVISFDVLASKREAEARRAREEAAGKNMLAPMYIEGSIRAAEDMEKPAEADTIRTKAVALVAVYENEKGSGGVLTDARDGKQYKTVRMGSKTWMAENLNYDMEGSKCYEDKQANCDKYGKTYSWNAAMGACPSGWSLPTTTDWDNLLRFADGKSGTSSPYMSRTAGGYLKAKSGWNNFKGKSGNGTDNYGFAALPGGYSGSPGGFDGLFSVNSAGDDGNWWSATEYDANRAIYYVLQSFSNGNNFGRSRKDYSISVRCVAD